MSVEVEVSPETWRESSIQTIKTAQTIITQTHQCVENNRLGDPLPILREMCVRESNNRILMYMRSTRAVVMKLRRCHVDTNEEIKALTRGKEMLEKALEHKRKDIALNQESMELRALRPSREKELDGPDQLLLSERSHLLSLKKLLEAQLAKVQSQLQELSKARARLSAAIQERSRVTDLLCQSMMSAGGGGSLTTPRQRTGRPSSGNNASRSQVGLPRMHVGGGSRAKTMSSHSTINLSSRHAKSFSAPAPLSFVPNLEGFHNGSAAGKKLASSEDGSRYPTPPKSAREPNEDGECPTTPPQIEGLSPEAQQSMDAAKEAMAKSKVIRREIAEATDHTHRMQVAAHAAVNEGLTRKLAQTVTLTQHLQVSKGETKLALQVAQRNHDAQERAVGYIQGPVSSADLTTRERLDRPVVQVYQRHVGTDLPEAAHFIQATGIYNESMEETRRNMALLKLAKKRLNHDIKDKRSASEIDANVVRLRRRKVDHRWVVQGRSYLPKPSTAPAVLLRPPKH